VDRWSVERGAICRRHGELSGEHGEIRVSRTGRSAGEGMKRVQCRAQSEECGAIRVKQSAPSVERGVILVRCGQKPSSSEISGWSGKRKSVEHGDIRKQHRELGVKQRSDLLCSIESQVSSTKQFVSGAKCKRLEPATRSK